MSTRSDLILDGSWNGVPFFYEDAGWNPGLRGQLHEYPDRDKGYFEPLGQRTAQFTLDIFVLGDDWIDQRKALLAAFATTTGTLVHPTDGPMSAICIDVRAQETVSKLGRADFSVTFLPGNTPSAPPGRDTGSDIDSGAGNAAIASQADFSDNYSTVNQPFDVLTAAQSSLSSALGTIRGAVGFATNTIGGALSWFQYGISTVGAVVRTALLDESIVAGVFAQFGANSSDSSGGNGSSPATTQQAVTWVADLATTIGNVSVLGSYSGLPAQIGSLVSGISGLGPTGSGTPFSSWAQQRRLGIARTVTRAASSTDASAGYVQSPIGGYSKATIAAVLQQQLALAAAAARPVLAPGAAAQTVTNSNAVFDLIRQAALIEAAGAFSAMPFTSRQEAFAARDLVADAIDAECDIAETASVRIALQALRIAVVNDARARSQALPDVTPLTLPRPLPAVVLAARLYDDPGMAADLVARNGVDNSLFMPAGVALEALASG